MAPEPSSSRRCLSACAKLNDIQRAFSDTAAVIVRQLGKNDGTCIKLLKKSYYLIRTFWLFGTVWKLNNFSAHSEYHLGTTEWQKIY